MTAPAFETTACVRAARQGDAAAVEGLVARFTPWLLAQARFRLAGRLAAVAEPEDLVQDTWLIALPRLPTLRPRFGRVTPVLVRFLSTVLRRRLQALLERELARRPHQPLADDLQLTASVVSGFAQAATSERAGILWAGLRQLGERDQALIILRGLEQNPFREIAELLGIASSAAIVGYHRACARLRQRLPAQLLLDLDL